VSSVAFLRPKHSKNPLAAGLQLQLSPRSFAGFRGMEGQGRKGEEEIMKKEKG